MKMYLKTLFNQMIQANKIDGKAQKYLEKQKKTLESFVVGAPDLSGHIIKNIYARGDEFVVYDNADSTIHQSIKVIIYSKIDEDNSKIVAFNNIKKNLDKLKTVLYRSGDNPIHKQRAASAIVIALHEPEKHQEANNLLVEITQDIEKEFEGKLLGRLSYLGGALTITIITIVLAFFAYIFRENNFFKSNELLSLILYCSMFAGIGGFFSVSLKSQSIFIMQATNKLMYFIYGLERNIISVIAGIACFILLSSGIIFANIKDGNTGIYFMMTVCFFSGFSEKFIPNALSTFGNDSPS